jgi:hypothetical protein
MPKCPKGCLEKAEKNPRLETTSQGWKGHATYERPHGDMKISGMVAYGTNPLMVYLSKMAGKRVNQSYVMCKRFSHGNLLMHGGQRKKIQGRTALFKLLGAAYVIKVAWSRARASGASFSKNPRARSVPGAIYFSVFFIYLLFIHNAFF